MIRFRLYYDKDAEISWLQSMCDRGWGFQSFFLGFYRFRRCEPGKYKYQIDLLEDPFEAADDFKDFMRENSIDILCQWYRWIYLRRDAEKGDFELYTDTASLINQYVRIKNFFFFALVIELVCTVIEMFAMFQTQSLIFACFFLLLLFIDICIIRIITKCKFKINELSI